MKRPSPEPNGVASNLRRLSSSRPTLAFVLGSGFSHALSGARVEAEVSDTELAGFPPVGVRGHAGKLVIGCLRGTPMIALEGRAHYYEGHSMSQLTFPVRVLAAYGIQDLVLTNAAGGINHRFRAGNFMVITDHINCMGANPLWGAAAPGLERFVDLSAVYDPKLTGLLRRAARASGVKLHSGVYAAVSGPSYETPAEVRAFRRMGADAVGMSTVPEAIVARQCGLRVAALSCITNPAGAGSSGAALSHKEVLETTVRVRALAVQMLTKFAEYYGSPA